MSFVDTVKEFIGFGDIEEDDEEFEYEEPVEEVHRSGKNKVVPLNPAQTQAKIIVLKPKCFSNSTAVADELKKRRPVVIDVGALDPDEARRVVDFIAGTVYGINGNMQKVSGGIFLATPSHMDIAGEVLTSGENGSFEWNMF